MPKFKHIPSGKLIHSTSPAQSARYRRSSRFTELPDTPESHETPTFAPDATEPPSGTPDTSQPPEGTVSQVLAWVDNNPQRARQALDAEKQGRNRITLTAKLRRIT